MEKEILCTHIAVDCVRNDKQDIRIGGPEFIGYDFYVDKNETKEMKKFIINTLREFGTPLENIYVEGTVTKNQAKVWTKDKIYNCIKNNEAGIENEYFEKTNEREM
jgi:hypothetical protein